MYGSASPEHPTAPAHRPVTSRGLARLLLLIAPGLLCCAGALALPALHAAPRPSPSLARPPALPLPPLALRSSRKDAPSGGLVPPAAPSDVPAPTPPGPPANRPLPLRQVLLASLALGPLLLGGPAPARAAELLEGTGLGDALIDILQFGIKQVEATGDAGPIFLWAFLSLAELVPLFPTQPLYLAAGLLFGSPQGILPAWAGTLTAALVAFVLCKQLGAPGGPLYGLVKFAMQKEMQDDPVGGVELENSLDKVVGDKDFLASVGKMVLLRLSPVIPFSVSNYLCGLSGMRFLPFAVGTAVGTAPWAVLYVTLGATGHDLLQTGGEFKDLLGMVVDKATAVLADPRAQALAFAITALLAAVLVSPLLPSNKGDKKPPGNPPP